MATGAEHALANTAERRAKSLLRRMSARISSRLIR